MKRLLIGTIVLLVALPSPRAASAQVASLPEGATPVGLFLDGRPFVRGIIILDSRSGPEGARLYVSVAELERCCIAELHVERSALRVSGSSEAGIRVRDSGEGDGTGLRLHAERDVEISSSLHYIGRDAYVPFADLASALGTTSLEPAENFFDAVRTLTGMRDVEISGAGEYEWSGSSGGDDWGPALDIRTGDRCALCAGPVDTRGGS